MEETQKFFLCTVDGCSMRFSNLENYAVHKKKHEMVLNLGNGQKTNVFVADQTPTPTRFIRNCEEVGLFQDLQNVNPFEETFRKAVEASKVGISHLESLHVPATDDTLHTPHVFPNINEVHSLTNLVPATSVIETTSENKSPTRIELEQLPTILQTEPTVIEIADPADLDSEIEIDILGNTGILIKEESEASQHISSRASSVEEELEQLPMLLESEPTVIEIADHADLDSEIEIDILGNTGILIKEESEASQQISSRASSVDSGCKLAMSSEDTVQVVFRMPDGRLVQLSGVSMDSIPSTQLPVQQVPPTIVQEAPLSQMSPSQNAVLINTQFVQATAQIAQISSEGQSSLIALPTSTNDATVISSADLEFVNSPQERLSAAKLKLKQRIQFNTKKKQSPSKEIELRNIASRKQGAVLHSQHVSSDGSDASVSPISRGKRIPNLTSVVDEQKLRFRERNRAAAMRCRERRKHWIIDLEKRANETQRINQQLSAEVTKLRSELVQLKTLLLAHKDCSVTKAMQQRGVTAISANSVKPQVLCSNNQVLTFAEMPKAVPATANAASEDTRRKIVLLSKPGLKRRRQAALPALNVVENGTIQTNDSQVKQTQTAQVMTVSQPITLTPSNSVPVQISSTGSRDLKSTLISEPVTTESQTCYITVAAPTLISTGAPTSNLAIKSAPSTSTSYLMPTKLCLPTADSLPQVIKFSSGILGTDLSEVLQGNVTLANGDSMDSGHGSDIEILAEIPNRPEENR